MATLDKEFLKLIGRRIIDRESAIGIDIGLKDEEKEALLKGEYPLTYKWIEEIANKLYVHPLRLLSVNYKNLKIKFRSADENYLDLLKQIEEVIHILIVNNVLKENKIIDLSDEYENMIKEKFENFIIGTTIAKEFREEYELGDEPVNLFEFCFQRNFYPLVIKGNQIEGALIILENYAIALITKSYIPRMHWTLAHELGHLVMHRKQSLVPDKEINLNNKNPEEITANYFASEIIMPVEAFKKVIIKSNFDRLKEYCISKEALKIKLDKLDALNVKLDKSKIERIEEFRPTCDASFLTDYTLNRVIIENISLYRGKLRETVENILWFPESI